MFYLYNFWDMLTYGYSSHNNQKKKVLLLGDGFFARGFLQTIDYNKYDITQIYRDKFINPQDIFYSFQRNQIYQNDNQVHIRDKINIFFNKFNIKFNNKSITKIEENINKLEIFRNNAIINSKLYFFDYMVIGLGAQKSLKDWTNELNGLIKQNNKQIDIIGAGPVGFEISMMLNKQNKINIYDVFTEDKIFPYVSTYQKKYLLNLLNEKNIKLNLGGFYNANAEQNKDNYKIFCVGTRPNNLTIDIKINDKLQLYIDSVLHENIYMGGDCIGLQKNIQYIKNAQVAYQQGVYVARRLNKEIDNSEVFTYKSHGIALNIDDKNVLIENHSIIPDGIYPDFITHLYSIFCV